MTWTALRDGATYAGGQSVDVDCPLDTVPVFARNGATHGLDGLL